MIVSDSVYSIKTAALLWFMTGTSDGDAGAEPLRADRRDIAPSHPATAVAG